MIEQIELRLPTMRRGCHLITGEVLRSLPKLPEKGLLNIFVKHTSCGLTINENSDPAVLHDLSALFDRLAPENEPYYRHTMEGADDMPAHAKSTLAGVSLTIPISHHRLNLGTWQGIYLCEYRDYGGQRTIVLTVYS
ncbi:MAG: secondary thiamine-phosphate synthase enzyme YjbQ [Muribaculaceae bacterium]|nr:secondary thiamine-phosphate synthase enzyme YjbQ [Muribaculaceae bacterium]